MKEFYKTVILSELKFGSKESNIKAANNFLKYVQCELLIVNGGLFKSESFGNTDQWKKRHNKFFNRLASMVNADGTKVVIVGGVNEYWMKSADFFKKNGIEVVKEFAIKRPAANYLVVPGDIFHHIFYKKFGIQTLSGYFAQFNYWFADRILGLKTNETGKIFKRFGNFGQFISEFENFMTEFAVRKGYDGIICAHNHYPTIKKVNNVTYMNSGDWVESFSALVEDENGSWRLSYNAASRSITQKGEKTASLAKPTQKRQVVSQ